MKKPYLDHLSNASDLVTTYEATRAGFLEIALEKNKAASPFVEQAKILKSVAIKTKNPYELLKIESIRPAVIAAAGFSDKASRYIQPEDYENLITEFIENFLVPAKSSYVDELVYRFLLTRGDSIGGSLRNQIGKLAQKKMISSLISALELFEYEYLVLIESKNKKSWQSSGNVSSGQEGLITGISWQNGNKRRTLVINFNVPVVGNNVDICVLSCGYEQIKEMIERSPESYIALGELKGGIDPAGADEHWKTARSAFSRIRKSFSDIEQLPDTFFIGAAIEKNMATEIWNMLDTNVLSNAANLTNSDQLSSVIAWLVSL